MKALFDASEALSNAKEKLYDADSYAGRGVYRDRFYKIATKFEKFQKEFSKMYSDIYNDLNS